MSPMSRRDFLKLSSLVPFCAPHRFWNWNGTCGASVNAVEGYASVTSVLQGRTIRLHASSASPAIMRMDIVRVGRVDVPMRSRDVLVGSYAAAPNAPESGCGWPPFYRFRVPHTWPSGYYRVDIAPIGGEAKPLCAFVVKARRPAAPILMAFAVTTTQAYNGWPDCFPGRSLYYSTDPNRLRQVSFARPDKYEHYVAGQLEFLKWLESNGYPVEYCTSIDLHTGPAFLGKYQLLLSVGHDEYWSKEMRDHVEAFIGHGGNVAFFSGNTCYFQVRFADHNRTMICYKDAREDPLTGVDNDRVTVEWQHAPVHRPENTLTGVGTLYGAQCFSNFSAMDTKSYQVHFARHWVFEGTGLADGDHFGEGERIIGYEADAAHFEWVNGFPIVTGDDGTPSSFVILALADLTDWPDPPVKPPGGGWATMGIYHRKGTVFTAATTDWVSGFRCPESAVHQITRNVLNGLSNIQGLATDALNRKYQELGGRNGLLGAPVSPKYLNPDGAGRRQHFQHGQIYWSPSTGAYVILHSPLWEKWSALGWEQGILGYPDTDEFVNPDGTGRRQHFQHGHLYWHPRTGAYSMRNSRLWEKWSGLGWERGFLGYPITDELVAPDGHGRYHHFEGGSIYWTPETGAHEVHGAIRDTWAALGWERGQLGYPVSDEYSAPVYGWGGRRSDFTGGFISWTPVEGTQVVFY
jgi:LGFP repeat